MNQSRWKRFWTVCQKIFGAGWIHLSTYNLMEVYGLENIEAASRARPILLAANHRSFFDMYTVSTVLFRNTSWRKQLFFPVRGRFFYDSPTGLFVNLVMGWWSMYPPFFASGENPIIEKRIQVDANALGSTDRASALAGPGPGHRWPTSLPGIPDSGRTSQPWPWQLDPTKSNALVTFRTESQRPLNDAKLCGFPPPRQKGKHYKRPPEETQHFVPNRY